MASRETTVSSARARRPTRDRLIRAAVTLFQSRGYHGTGIADILARADAPRGSLYHHFPGGKEQIAAAAMDWLREEVARFLDQVAREGGGCRLMVEGIARYMAEGIRHGRKARGGLMTVLVQDAVADSPVIAAAVRRHIEAVRERLVLAYETERWVGDPSAFADGALAVTQGAAVLARAEAVPERVVEIVEQWLDNVLRGRTR